MAGKSVQAVRRSQFLSTHVFSRLLEAAVFSHRVSQENAAEATVPFMTYLRVTRQLSHRILLVTQASPDSVWEETTQGCEYQELRVTGATLVSIIQAMPLF